MTDRGAMSIPEAAKWLGISRNYAYLEAKRGKIPTFRWGKRVLVKVADLEKMLDEIGNCKVTKNHPMESLETT